MDEVSLRENAIAREQLLELERMREAGVELAGQQTLNGLRVMYARKPWLAPAK